MSFDEEIKIVEIDNLESQWSSLQEGEVFVLSNKSFELQGFFGRIKDVFENDPSVGIVTTDHEIFDNGMRVYVSAPANDINDNPYFIKKVSGFQISVNPNNKLISVAQSYINNGFKIEHVADPYFGFSA